MVEEWPVAAPPAADRKVERARFGGGGRLATATADFFLDPAERLTDQERALMTAMLLGLIGSVADELRVRAPDAVAEASETGPAQLLGRLIRAQLLADERLVSVLIKRAVAARIARQGEFETGQRLLGLQVGDDDPEAAAAAMSVALARGRSRGRPRVGLHDLEPATAGQVVHAIAAALSSGEPGADRALAAAGEELLARRDSRQALDGAEDRLIESLDRAERLDDTLLLSLAAGTEASLLAHALARLAGVPSEHAWDMLAAPAAGQLALLLRLARRPRSTAAALFVALGPALALADPGAEIDLFDALSEAQVEAARMTLQLPAAFRHAAEALAHHA